MIKKHKMAFDGDFANLDDEIKCQVRAIRNNDFEIIKRIHASTITADEIKRYIARDIKDKGEMPAEADEWDSDLDRTMYQEFWGELREYKKPPPLQVGDQARKSQSVMRDGM